MNKKFISAQMQRIAISTNKTKITQSKQVPKYMPVRPTILKPDVYVSSAKKQSSNPIIDILTGKILK